ncbi:hypothetical protein BRC76_05995 [Halobacteriales archaeon QH_8_67_36]|nr:MAG: hypothetical protein BRC76_05995 [Halobacteriales archaeon QH_8_67_36]
MDEVLTVVEILADPGFEGVVTWLLRLVWPALLLAGSGLWLLSEMGLVVVSAPLVLVGPVLLVVPSILLPVAECA